MKALLLVLLVQLSIGGVGPAIADADAMQAALPAPAEGYQSEIEEMTDAHLVAFSWASEDEETYFVVEINVEGPAVAGFKKTFRAMTFAMDTVQAGGQTFTFDGDMYTTLINKSVLVRVYGTAPGPIKLAAVNQLNLAPLVSLAGGG